MNIKNLRKNKKGFTLIEIIVVIVILAVLMAVAVPSVLNYINEADSAKIMAQSRSVMSTSQIEVAKELTSSNGLTSDEITALPTKIATNSGVTVTNLKIYTGTITDAAVADNGDITVTGGTEIAVVAANAATKPDVTAISGTIDGKVVLSVVNDKVYVQK